MTAADSKLPEPFFGCKNDFCATEVSYPASMMHFWAGETSDPEADADPDYYVGPGWYCTCCIENADGPELRSSLPRLDAEIESRASQHYQED